MTDVNDQFDLFFTSPAKPTCFAESTQEVSDFFRHSDCDLKLGVRIIEKDIEKGLLVKNDKGYYDLCLYAEAKFSRGISESKLRFQEESARKLELANAETDGRLISRKFVEDIFFKIGGLIKSNLMPLSKKISSAIKGETDPFAIDQIIQFEVRNVLDSIGNNIKSVFFGKKKEEQEDGQND